MVPLELTLSQLVNTERAATPKAQQDWSQAVLHLRMVMPACLPFCNPSREKLNWTHRCWATSACRTSLSNFSLALSLSTSVPVSWEKVWTSFSCLLDVILMMIKDSHLGSSLPHKLPHSISLSLCVWPALILLCYILNLTPESQRQRVFILHTLPCSCYVFANSHLCLESKCCIFYAWPALQQLPSDKPQLLCRATQANITL